MKSLLIFLLIFFFLLSSEAEGLAFFALILYLSYLVGSLRSPSVIGSRGECKVRNKIQSYARKNPEYISFHNLTLEAPDGTTQIDHVIISPYGIFVIETKNYKGWIFGDENKKMWTQSIYRKKFKFQNPLRQNYKHVKAVQSLLNLNMNQIISVVVFVGNSHFKTAMPNNVLLLGELITFIELYQQQILSIDELETYAEKLRKPSCTAAENHEKHINNVTQNAYKPVCPRCGKPMVLRTAKKGCDEGNQFWGCSGYPACNATKDI